MSATTDITCEFCAAQRHESKGWCVIELPSCCKRGEVWCCDVCVNDPEIRNVKIRDADDDSDSDDDDNFRCDKCNCVKDRDFHISLNGDDSGNTICEECIDDYIAERVLEARRLVQAREICKECKCGSMNLDDEHEGVPITCNKCSGLWCYDCGGDDLCDDCNSDVDEEEEE